jgi:hypothetical protein
MSNTSFTPSKPVEEWSRHGKRNLNKLTTTIDCSTIGYMLHPEIMSSLPHAPKVADVATGTGIFLLELAKTLPAASELHGFDISPAQFPKAHVPANIQFHVANAKTPFSSEFHEKFDVVHLRLLIPAMSGDDWKTVTQNVCMLLKPGGAIQWTEGNFIQLYPALRGSSDPRWTSVRLSTYVRTWLDLPGFEWRERLAPSSSGWSSLPCIFQELGFQDVEDDVVSSDRLGEEGRRLGTEIEMAAYEGSFRIAGMSDSEIEVIRKPAEADAANGAYVRWDMHVVRGFKTNKNVRFITSDR